MHRSRFAPSLFAVPVTIVWLAAIASTAGGCVATASNPTPRGVMVNGPPPLPLQEERPAPPGAAAVWVNGYWHWTGAQYTWIPGHWENAPPGQSWYAPRYTASEGSFFYQPGGWKPSAAALTSGAPR